MRLETLTRNTLNESEIRMKLHTAYTDYILVSAGLSARRMFPGQNARTLSPEKVTGWPRSDVNNVYDVNRVQARPILTPNMATSYPIPDLSQSLSLLRTGRPTVLGSSALALIAYLNMNTNQHSTTAFRNV